MVTNNYYKNGLFDIKILFNKKIKKLKCLNFKNKSSLDNRL